MHCIWSISGRYEEDVEVGGGGGGRRAEGGGERRVGEEGGGGGGEGGGGGGGYLQWAPVTGHGLRCAESWRRREEGGVGPGGHCPTANLLAVEM